MMIMAKPSQLARLSSGKLKKTCKIGQSLSFKKENIEDIYFSYFGTRLPTKAMSIRVQLQCVLPFEFAPSLSVCVWSASQDICSAHTDSASLTKMNKLDDQNISLPRSIIMKWTNLLTRIFCQACSLRTLWDLCAKLCKTICNISMVYRKLVLKQAV